MASALCVYCDKLFDKLLQTHLIVKEGYKFFDVLIKASPTTIVLTLV